MSIKNLPPELVLKAANLLEKLDLMEKSPPDPKIEKWIVANKERFHKEYGDRGNEVLYKTAWKKYEEDLDGIRNPEMDVTTEEPGIEAFTLNYEESDVVSDSPSLKSVEEEKHQEDGELLRRKHTFDAISGLPSLGEGDEEHEEKEAKLEKQEDKGISQYEKAHEKNKKLHKGFKKDDKEETKEKQIQKKEDRIVNNLKKVHEKGKNIHEQKYASPEPSSAIGYRENPECVKHADLVYDVTIVGGERTEGYRLLLQFPDERCMMLPSTEFPPSTNIEDLKVLASGIPDEYKEIDRAIELALAYPHLDPHFSGNEKK